MFEAGVCSWHTYWMRFRCKTWLEKKKCTHFRWCAQQPRCARLCEFAHCRPERFVAFGRARETGRIRLTEVDAGGTYVVLQRAVITRCENDRIHRAICREFSGRNPPIVCRALMYFWEGSEYRSIHHQPSRRNFLYKLLRYFFLKKVLENI